jgi:hypothetical protein
MTDGWREDLPGMSFAEFYDRFGASCRTKNFLPLPPGGAGGLRLAARVLLGKAETTGKRFFAPPGTSELPREFIRLDPWEAGYVYAVAQRAEHGIVEIGRFNGGSTFLFACANQHVPIWSVDIAPRDDHLLTRLLAVTDVGGKVELIVADSHRDELSQIGDFDLLFVDGDHTRAGALADLETFFPRLRAGGDVLVHDCYPEMEVQLAVFDFLARHDVQIVRSPDISSLHWHTEAGSIAHFRKRAL